MQAKVGVAPVPNHFGDVCKRKYFVHSVAVCLGLILSPHKTYLLLFLGTVSQAVWFYPLVACDKRNTAAINDANSGEQEKKLEEE
jgi:hypothetical protein